MYPKWLASAEAAGDAGEGPARVGGPAGAPEPGPSDPPQPQGPSPGAADLGGDLLRVPFLRRLWMVADDASLASIGWSDDGASLVLDQELFQLEILDLGGADRIFQANSVKSFTQELRRQGFTRQRAPKGTMIYQHCMFLRDQPQLLDDMEREGGLGAADAPGPREPAKRRRQQMPTRRSLRLLGRNASKEATSKGQEDVAATRGSGGASSPPPPVDLPAACPEGGSLPGELGGPGDEGTSGHNSSGHATPAPQPPAAQEELDEEPSSSTAFPAGYTSVLSLCNSCYAILPTLLSTLSPGDETDETDETDEEDPEDMEDMEDLEDLEDLEDPQDDSRFKCTACEQLKDKAHH